MSRASRRKVQKQRKRSEPGAAGEPAAEAGQIRELIAQGRSKTALERAKLLHQRQGDAASQALVIDAYLARIDGLVSAGMAQEATALIELVGARLPSARGRLESRHARLRMRAGGTGAVVRPLLDAALPSEERAQIELLLRRELTDPATLAGCDALPADHPLRAGAREVIEALAIVTTREASDAEIALTSIPRRSPLAPWRMLVRAIAFFYRREDEAAAQALAAIPADAAPARLVPALTAMLRDETGGALPVAAQELVRSVLSRAGSLRSALKQVERELTEGEYLEDLAKAARTAMRVCERTRPELVESLRQHLWARGILENVPAADMRRTLGTAPRRSSHYWRLLARAFESMPDPLLACAAWEHFRLHAEAEGLLEPTGAGMGHLLRHMAELAADAASSQFRLERRDFAHSFDGFAAEYEDQPAAIRAVVAGRNPRIDPDFLDPEILYERAAAADPQRETFSEWVGYLSTNRGDCELERAAQLWARALPRDCEPLMLQARLCKERGALKKAEAFLERAEEIDGLNSEVRRTRRRLAIARVLRHLKTGKLHLALAGVARFEQLAQARDADRPVVLAALRWVAARLGGDAEQERSAREEVALGLGGEAGAGVLLSAVARLAGMRGALPQVMVRGLAAAELDALLAAMARIARVTRDLDLAIEIPEPLWEAASKRLEKVAAKCSLSSELLVELGAGAHAAGVLRLAYAVSAAGLARGGPLLGRFLLLRAQALPRSEVARRESCAGAAAARSRSGGDQELLGEIVSWYHAARLDGELLANTMDEVAVDGVVTRELRAGRYPAGAPVATGRQPTVRRRRSKKRTQRPVQVPLDFEPPDLDFLGGEEAFDESAAQAMDLLDDLGIDGSDPISTELIKALERATERAGRPLSYEETLADPEFRTALAELFARATGIPRSQAEAVVKQAAIQGR